MSHIAVDLKVIEGLAAAVARHANVDEDRIGWGLVRLWHRTWSDKALTRNRASLAGVFGGDRIDAVIVALIDFDFLEALPDGSFRVRGAARYLRLKAALSKGGKAAAGNLKRGSSREPATESPGSRAGNIPGSSPALPPSTEHRAPSTIKEDLASHPIRDAWNAGRVAPMPVWSTTDGARKKHADARLTEHPEPEFWRDVVAKVRASDFLSGRKNDFRATPDWLLKPANLTKVLEGNYDGNGPPRGLAPPVDAATQVHTTREVHDF